VTKYDFGRNYDTNAAANYQKYFVPAIGAPVAAELIKVAALEAGERVLDVGCGTGVVTRLAAEKTGTQVHGLDPNPGMLAVAQSVAQAEMSIAWHQASAEKIPLPDESFDVVLCQMALQFVPDKASAVREMYRVLVPGGRLVLNTPGHMPAFFSAMEGALSKHLSPEAGTFLKAVFSLHDPNEVQELLTAGGFRDASVRMATVPQELPPLREFLWQYLHSTPLAEVVRQMDDARLAALERDVVESTEDLVKDGRVTIGQDIVVATGRK
jgi:ubiquinone/menaquinone biosynthesis C-methylase UbiE